MEILVLLLLFVGIPKVLLMIGLADDRRKAKKEAARIPAEIVTEEKSYEAQIRYVRFRIDDLYEILEDGFYKGHPLEYDTALKIKADIEKLQNQLRRLEAK